MTLRRLPRVDSSRRRVDLDRITELSPEPVADGAAAMALPATAARGSLRGRPGRPSPSPPIRPRLSPSRARGAFRWVAGEVGHAAATAVEAVDVPPLWSWSSAR